MTNHLCGMLQPIILNRFARESFSLYSKGKRTELLFPSEKMGGHKEAETSISLSFIQSLTVHDEVYLVDTFGLIGSVGGSLGLFIGFSFFHYILDGFDLLLSYVNKN